MYEIVLDDIPMSSNNDKLLPVTISKKFYSLLKQHAICYPMYLYL